MLECWGRAVLVFQLNYFRSRNWSLEEKFSASNWPVNWHTDYELWRSFLFMHQTLVPLFVAMLVNLVTNIFSRSWREDTMPNDTVLPEDFRLYFSFITYHGCAFAVASSHDWLCVGVWLHACLLVVFWSPEDSCKFCVCDLTVLLVVGGWVWVFVFRCRWCCQKETKKHFFKILLSYAAVLLHFEVARKRRKGCRVLIAGCIQYVLFFLRALFVGQLWLVSSSKGCDPKGHALLLQCCCISELCSLELHHLLTCPTEVCCFASWWRVVK